MKDKYRQLISELTDKELLFQLYLTQLILFILSMGLGFILYRVPIKVDLLKWNDPNILKYGLTSALLIVLIDWILMKSLPSSLYDDGGLNKRVFSGKSTLHIAFIAAIVAISEELLFRGIIQTSLGIWVASITFALIHYRYLFNKFLFLNIVLLSFFIGFIYEKTGNLAVTIFMHFMIDLLLGLMIKYEFPKRDVE